jgi:hypothetical protein
MKVIVAERQRSLSTQTEIDRIEDRALGRVAGAN